jgi:orotate phosphoribosyltransferase
MNQEEIMEILQETGAIRKGHFKLTSGLHADTYYQCAIALENPHITEKMGDEIAKLYDPDSIDVVISPALGGIILGFAVALAMGKRFIWAERADGKMVFRRGFAVAKNERALVVEDVVTTGGSVEEVLNLIRESGGKAAGAACLMNRGGLASIGGVELNSLVTALTEAFEETNCPLCAAGKPIESPGSRRI